MAAVSSATFAGARQDLRPVAGPVQAAVPVHGAASDLEPAAAEFVGEPGRVSRQVTVRAELQPLVADLGDLVEEPLPRCLPRVVGEPHSPRVGAGAQLRDGSSPRPSCVVGCWPRAELGHLFPSTWRDVGGGAARASSSWLSSSSSLPPAIRPASSSRVIWLFA